MQDFATVVVAFYNKVQYLELILASLERQTTKNFEVIIADDGSNPESVKAVQRLILTSALDISHVWHEDRGFRKNKILNEAVRQSRYDYLIFIDGDCIAHRDFVRGHLSEKHEKVCLTGRRVNVSEKITKELTPEKISKGYLEKHFYKLVWDGFFGGSVDVEKGLYFRSSWLRSAFNAKKRGIVGCNFSLHKRDLLDINGFDERYVAPSVGEDSDVEYRLDLNGVAVRSVNHIAVQYHLHHTLQPRPQENFDLFEQVKKDARAFTPFGIRTMTGKQP